MTANIYLGDCMEGMAKGIKYDLAIVDPPYGINFAKTHTGNGWIVRPPKDWDKKIPDSTFFSSLFESSTNQIIWGGNYFTHFLYPSMGWVFWDKGQRDFSLADGELAWTSFDKALRCFDFSRALLNQQRGDHPTEKPHQLYKWLLKNYAKEGQSILDTHGGSMSIVLACIDMGFDITVYEKDPDYFAAAKKRIQNYCKQLPLFGDPPIIKFYV